MRLGKHHDRVCITYLPQLLGGPVPVVWAQVSVSERKPSHSVQCFLDLCTATQQCAAITVVAQSDLFTHNLQCVHM